MWTFAMNAEGEPVSGCISTGSPKPERGVECPNVHRLRAKHTARLQVVLSREAQRASAASSASVQAQSVVPPKPHTIPAIRDGAQAVDLQLIAEGCQEHFAVRHCRTAKLRKVAGVIGRVLMTMPELHKPALRVE